jgi:hypothetical protein
MKNTPRRHQQQYACKAALAPPSLSVVAVPNSNSAIPQSAPKSENFLSVKFQTKLVGAHPASSPCPHMLLFSWQAGTTSLLLSLCLVGWSAAPPLSPPRLTLLPLSGSPLPRSLRLCRPAASASSQGRIKVWFWGGSRRKKGWVFGFGFLILV